MLPHEQVAMNIRGLLARNGIKMVQLSSLLEVQADTVRRKMNGKIPITLDEVGIIADYLDVPFTTLIEGAEGYSKDSSPFTETT